MQHANQHLDSPERNLSGTRPLSSCLHVCSQGARICRIKREIRPNRPLRLTLTCRMSSRRPIQSCFGHGPGPLVRVSLNEVASAGRKRNAIHVPGIPTCASNDKRSATMKPSLQLTTYNSRLIRHSLSLKMVTRYRRENPHFPRLIASSTRTVLYFLRRNHEALKPRSRGGNIPFCSPVSSL